MIHDSGLEIKNRCTETPEITQICATIPDSGLEIKNRCTENPEISRIATVPSSRQQRMARLQHGRAVQAEAGCHEGGIILSKKPPEGRLSPPLQRCLCPILFFVATTKNGPPAAWSCCAGGDRMPRRRHKPKIKAAGVAPVPAATVAQLHAPACNRHTATCPRRCSDQRKRP